MLAAEIHGEVELVRGLVEFMGGCCAGDGNKESTIAGKLMAINFHDEQLLGPSVSMSHRGLDLLGEL